MANFFNPYMKGPDFGQGVNSTIDDVLMQILMKKMMGDRGQTSMGETQLPRDNPMGGVKANPQPQQSAPAQPMFSAQQGMAGGMGGGSFMPGRGQSALDQQITAMLAKILGGNRGGLMG
jgi:hypothetical protein